MTHVNLAINVKRLPALLGNFDYVKLAVAIRDVVAAVHHARSDHGGSAFDEGCGTPGINTTRNRLPVALVNAHDQEPTLRVCEGGEVASYLAGCSCISFEFETVIFRLTEQLIDVFEKPSHPLRLLDIAA